MESRFETMITKYSQLVYRCAYGYCKNREDAEDIMQEVYYKYLTKAPIFNDEQHERAWFLRVTINLSKNYVKTFWRKKVDTLEQDIPHITEEEKGVWDVIHQLPNKYRIVIELHYIEGYSIKEIAEILKRKQSTIGTWLERGKKKLEAEWRSYNE